MDENPLRCAAPYPDGGAPLCYYFNETNDKSPALYSTPYHPDLCAILCKVFKLDDWRPGQLPACVAALEEKDVVVTLPTGSGKSLCYQLPAILQYGVQRKITVVIVPLLSLLKDQVCKLLALNLKAIGLYSGLDPNIINDCYKYLEELSLPKPIFFFLAPEGLEGRHGLLLQRLYTNGFLARIVIDEAQCIIRRPGDNFRKAFGILTKLRDQYPMLPLTLLSGSTGIRSTLEIISKFQLKGCYIVSGTPNRTNIRYSILESCGVEKQIIQFINSQHHYYSGILYIRSAHGCKEFVKILKNNNIKAACYHGSMDDADKNRVYKLWMDEEIPIVVATNAFGLGIDKPNVRFIIHKDVPKDMDQYIQETGRAGRDGLPAECVMFYSYSGILKNYGLVVSGFKEAKDEEIMAIPEASRSLLIMCEDTQSCRRRHIMVHFGLPLPEPGFTCGNCDICCLTAHTSDTVVDASMLAEEIIYQAVLIEAGKCQQTSPYTVELLYRHLYKHITSILNKIGKMEFELTGPNMKRIIVQLILSSVFEEYPRVAGTHDNWQWYIKVRRPFQPWTRPLLVPVTVEDMEE